MDELDRLCREMPDDEAPLDSIDLNAGALADESPNDAVKRLRGRGMKTADIATVLRMPPSTVRGVLYRAGLAKTQRKGQR
jgi:hypothetical protein